MFEDKTYEQNIPMTLVNAEFRASIVTNVTYDVELALPKGENFFGRCIISFDMKEVPSKKFYLDFRGLKIADLKINGNAIENANGENQTVFLNHALTLSS